MKAEEILVEKVEMVNFRWKVYALKIS